MDASLPRAPAPTGPLPPTLTALAAQYHADAVQLRAVQQSTAQAEHVYLNRLFEYFGPPDSPAALFSCIDAGTIAKCLTEYAAKHGPGSRSCMQKTVRLFLRFAYRAGYLARDLSALSPSPRTPRMAKVVQPMPPACIKALLEGIGTDSSAELRDRAIVCLLSTYGVRGVQVRRLRLDDVDWAHSRIHFAAVKRGRAVDQHLTAQVGNRLADYLLSGRPESSHREVFLHDHAPFAPLAHPRELSRILRKRIESLGVELPEGVRVGSHAFRHAFASRMYGRVPFKDVVDMLGHRDPASTLIYGKVDLANLRKAALPWPGGER